MISTTIAGLAGASAWSVSEYLVHRYLGHVYAKKRNIFAVEHVRHHATTSYFAATSKKAAAAAAVAVVTMPIASALVGGPLGLAFTIGFTGTYIGYEVAHRRCHTHPPTGPFGRWMRKNHFHHHFHNPNHNHGVTSPVWDHVFGTHDEPGVIKVPTRHAMQWLVDPATKQVWPQYQTDYALINKRKKSPKQAREVPIATAAVAAG